MIHLLEKWVSLLFIVVFSIVTYFAIQVPLPEGAMTLGRC